MRKFLQKCQKIAGCWECAVYGSRPPIASKPGSSPPVRPGLDNVMSQQWPDAICPCITSSSAYFRSFTLFLFEKTRQGTKSSGTGESCVTNESQKYPLPLFVQLLFLFVELKKSSFLSIFLSISVFAFPSTAGAPLAVSQSNTDLRQKLFLFPKFQGEPEQALCWLGWVSFAQEPWQIRELAHRCHCIHVSLSHSIKTLTPFPIPWPKYLLESLSLSLLNHPSLSLSLLLEPPPPRHRRQEADESLSRRKSERTLRSSCLIGWLWSVSQYGTKLY